MVRILAGTLVEVGRGRISSTTVGQLLTARGTRSQAGMTAPAHGLTLLAIRLGRASAQASPPDP
jgi:tRNA pseudouridine38-40 synthase